MAGNLEVINISLTRRVNSRLSVSTKPHFLLVVEIKATLEEMESAKVPLDKRDYCVDYLLSYLQCRNDKWPLVYRCHHEKHEYLHCQYEE